jgi:FOG: Ankyrin repeat
MPRNLRILLLVNVKWHFAWINSSSSHQETIKKTILILTVHNYDNLSFRHFRFPDRTPMHLAAENGHASIIELLADKFRASIFERTKDGSTLMHIASLNGHAECAMMLFKKGVYLHMPNKVKPNRKKMSVQGKKCK